MVQATHFLLRWLFLCRLVDERAEVQTWPHRPPGYYRHGSAWPPTDREAIVRALTSCQPGSPERLQTLEELRWETVMDFARRLIESNIAAVRSSTTTSSSTTTTTSTTSTTSTPYTKDDPDDLDRDPTIFSDLQQFLQDHHPLMQHAKESKHRWSFLHGIHVDDDVSSNCDDALSLDADEIPYGARSPNNKDNLHLPMSSAHSQLLFETRSYLPQLVSTVLHSPPSIVPGTTKDPISALRSLLIHQCRVDPSLGIELCWLLEAEVGRKWKALFEHRQQTGKRLILLVQADIAQAIATIGAEKASAFNLLQDAEMATALGRERTYEGCESTYSATTPWKNAMSMARLPRAISDLRCRHFGDSMHFVDRLTQISLDLRHVSPMHRRNFLQERLRELNQRLYRRMATRGRISMDVDFIEREENSRAYFLGHSVSLPTWTEETVQEDMIPHSIHFPLEPQCVRWPGGRKVDLSYGVEEDSELSKFERPQLNNGVVRVLRILPEKCRILDSRERCPFLVRMEVVETGLDANDARLYCMDENSLALTVEEAMGAMRQYGDSTLGNPAVGEVGFDPCEIPPELMRERVQHLPLHDEFIFSTLRDASKQEKSLNTNPKGIPRCGYQGSDETFLSPQMLGDYQTFEMVREHHYERLHQELQHQREKQFYSFHHDVPMVSSAEALSMGTTLLEKVFGRPWNTECENIQQESPFGNVPGWKLASFIVKAGEDIRKEALVMQIMSKLWTWFQAEIPSHMRPFLRPYTIMCVGGDAGLVECLPDVKSINEVKKETDGFTTLLNFFERAFCPAHPMHYPSKRDTISFEKARDNFLRSLVGYSVVCYILQIKDRHNANILIDREGHVMHIDFGFVLGETPKMGKVPLFSERAPFKLSAEFWEVIGGWSAFKRFCEMFEVAYAVAAAHSDEICTLVEAAMVNVSRNSELARSIADGVRNRIRMKADPKEQKIHIMNIVNDAITSWGTSTYDWLQRSMNGYQ